MLTHLSSFQYYVSKKVRYGSAHNILHRIFLSKRNHYVTTTKPKNKIRNKDILVPPIKANEEWILRFDGGARGNPGLGGAGAVLYFNSNELSDIKNSADKEVLSCQHFVSDNDVTCNQAEYLGLIEGLKHCVELNLPSLTVEGDSMLVIKQMTGEYRVTKAHLQQLHEVASSLAKRIPNVTYWHIPRERNSRADELSNLAMDSRSSGYLIENKELYEALLNNVPNKVGKKKKATAIIKKVDSKTETEEKSKNNTRSKNREAMHSTKIEKLKCIDSKSNVLNMIEENVTEECSANSEPMTESNYSAEKELPKKRKVEEAKIAHKTSKSKRKSKIIDNNIERKTSVPASSSKRSYSIVTQLTSGSTNHTALQQKRTHKLVIIPYMRINNQTFFVISDRLRYKNPDGINDIYVSKWSKETESDSVYTPPLRSLEFITDEVPSSRFDFLSLYEPYSIAPSNSSTDIAINSHSAQMFPTPSHAHANITDSALLDYLSHLKLQCRIVDRSTVWAAPKTNSATASISNISVEAGDDGLDLGMMNLNGTTSLSDLRQCNDDVDSDTKDLVDKNLYLENFSLSNGSKDPAEIVMDEMILEDWSHTPGIIEQRLNSIFQEQKISRKAPVKTSLPFEEMNATSIDSLSGAPIHQEQPSLFDSPAIANGTNTNQEAVNGGDVASDVDTHDYLFYDPRCSSITTYLIELEKPVKAQQMLQKINAKSAQALRKVLSKTRSVKPRVAAKHKKTLVNMGLVQLLTIPQQDLVPYLKTQSFKGKIVDQTLFSTALGLTYAQFFDGCKSL